MSVAEMEKRLTGETVALPEGSLYDLFVDLIFQGRGDQVLLYDEKKEFTVSDVRAMAEHTSGVLLHHFHKNNVQQPQVVGLLLRPSAEKVAYILAILKIGSAIVSLDPTLPPPRMTMILQASNAQFVLVSSGMAGYLPNTLDVIILEDLISDTKASTGIPYTIPNDPLVAVFFTSGSTGEPKAVRLRKKNIMNRLTWSWREFPFIRDDICCMKTSPLFVDSLTELFTPLFQGIPILIVERRDVIDIEMFLTVIHQGKVTRLIVVPSQLQAMLAMNEMDKSTDFFEFLKLVVCSGEELTADLANEFLRTTSQATLCNFYGSTETTGDISSAHFKSTNEIVELSAAGHLTVGKPVINTEIFIRDADEDTNGIRVGEICVSGFNITDDHPHYQMGDLGFIKDGYLYYAGRNDTQVKIRGHRIDVREIEEAVYQSHKGVKQVVTMGIGTELVAMYSTVPTGEHGELNDEILKSCRRKLPAHMMPTFFRVDAMPLQEHTGKIDRKKLRSLWVERVSCQSDDNTVVGIIANVLNFTKDELRIDQSFFELGGNSLLAVTALSKLSNIDKRLSFTDFINAKSIHDIDNLLNHKTQISYDPLDLCVYNSTQLTAADKTEVCDVLATEFTTNNLLDSTAGTSKAGFIRLLTSIFKDIMADDLSFCVRDSRSHQLVACCINLDTTTVINPIFEFDVVGAINDAVEAPVRELLKEEGGRWMDSLLSTVVASVPGSLRPRLLAMMEDEELRLAKEKGFNGIVTVNSHLVTQRLAEDYGYQLRNQVHVRSFEFQGTFPYAAVDDDFFIKCMVKYLH